MKGVDPVAMLTVYDYPTARALDTCDLDILFVGDSLAQTELGLSSTADIGLTEILHHVKAVARGVTQTHLLVDLPFGSYDTPDLAIQTGREVTAAGADSVKVEGPRYDVVERLTGEGIPVMGHVGLLPQTARRYLRQGTRVGSAARILEQAQRLEAVGCYSIVVEFMSHETARNITDKLAIPTIGIGAGSHCDGQVLVVSDMLGQYESVPSYVKKFAHLYETTVEAGRQYRDEVKQRTFPGG
jgi:3-methyl-2-oxobutanoate hydroxymethyltransferase